MGLLRLYIGTQKQLKGSRHGHPSLDVYLAKNNGNSLSVFQSELLILRSKQYGNK